MQESTDIPACTMKKAPTLILPNHWTSILPLSSDLQMPPALVLSPSPQMPQSLLLPESLQKPLNPLMPHYLQTPQILPLLDSLQMSPGSTVIRLSGFNLSLSSTCGSGSRKTSVRPWRGHTRYSPEHKMKLENFFLENSNYLSIEQR